MKGTRQQPEGRERRAERRTEDKKKQDILKVREKGQLTLSIETFPSARRNKIKETKTMDSDRFGIRKDRGDFAVKTWTGLG